MKVFFDACTSPVMARTLHGFISGDGHEAHHIRDLLSVQASDLEWMNYLATDGGDWLVVTGDHRIRRNKAEAAAFSQARLKGIALAKSFQTIPMNRRCAVLIERWPALFTMISGLKPPVFLEIGTRFGGKFTPLALKV